MKPISITPLLLGLLATGCPSSGDQNPRTLWLAPDGSELKVRLVDAEPLPF